MKIKPFVVEPRIIKKLTQTNKSMLAKGSFEGLAKLAAVARIQTLAELKSAGRGWLGGSFSCIDILTVLYHAGFIENTDLSMRERSSLFLSKGHAAPGHYSVLNTLNLIKNEELLLYKRLDGLPAHSERSIPGVDSDSGSLGQGLSKAIGAALTYRRQKASHKSYAVIGDGELQEGQLFEAFLSLKSHNVTNCVSIIDRNRMQSDSMTGDIKDAASWKNVFEGIGLEVMECNGHDHEEIFRTLEKIHGIKQPCVLIAHTLKGYGTKATTMENDTPRREGIWHSAIPDDATYLSMLLQLAGETGSDELVNDIDKWRRGNCPELKPAQKYKPLSKKAATLKNTMAGFSDALINAAQEYPELCVLDADLESSCRLTPFALEFPNRFYEMGISEQDMVSTAGGMALAGGIPFVATFASFFKRSYDQIFAVAAERLPIIFAGYYAGLDFFTDGKSHQSVNDIAFMRAIPNMEVYEPLTPKESQGLLFHLLERMTREKKCGTPSTPAYVRLHREPAIIEELSDFSFQPGGAYLFPSEPFRRSQKSQIGSETEIVSRKSEKSKGEGATPLLLAASPLMLKMSLEVQKRLEKTGDYLDVVGISSYLLNEIELQDNLPDPSISQNPSNVRCNRFYDLNKIMKTHGKVFSLESHIREGGLADFIAKIGKVSPVRIGANGLAGSSLLLEDMLSFHQISVSEIAQTIKTQTRRQLL